MKPVVFIHTNDAQLLAALVSAYSLTARSNHANAFDVRLLRFEQTPHLTRRDGRQYLYDGRVFTWRNRDLQAFAPLRRMVPQVMGFRGRALVLDPDVFAVGDVYELLRRDMGGKAILCRMRDTCHRGMETRVPSSGVMLLDCERLTHWRWDDDIDALFAHRLDYWEWIYLRAEPAGTIGLLEEEWNHFDTLNERTKLLHNTERLTQPWRTGLPVEFGLNSPDANRWHTLRRIKRLLFRQRAPRVHQSHPDPRQERFFFALLRECVERGVVTETLIETEIRRQHLRADAFAMLAAVDSVSHP